MLTLTLSPNSLAQAVCPKRYWYYKVRGRKALGKGAGAAAGTAVHAGFARYNRAESTALQEGALLTEWDKARDAGAFEEGDYRTPAYLQDALAQLRATMGPAMAGWRVLETEKRAKMVIGAVTEHHVHPGWRAYLPDNPNGDLTVACVEMEYVRDLVVEVIATGEVWVIDLKTASQDRQAEIAAYETSDQFKCYYWSGRRAHPEWNLKGVQPVRLLMRKPVVKKSEKTKPTYEVQLCKPIRYTDEIIAEWQDGVLRRAADLLRRNPDDPLDWPMVACLGTCFHPYGNCDYLPVCTLPPGDRLLKLSTTAFADTKDGREEAVLEGAP